VAAGHWPIVLVGPEVRPVLKQLAAGHIPQLVVLSYSEITPDTKIESVAMVSEVDNTQPAVGDEPPAPHFRRVDAAAKPI